MGLMKTIKAKVKNKLAKLRAMLALRKPVLIIVATLSAVILAGCQVTPSRAQSQTFEGCTFTFYVTSPTNATPSVELGTQAMAVETGGNDTLSTAQEISPEAKASSGVAVELRE